MPTGTSKSPRKMAGLGRERKGGQRARNPSPALGLSVPMGTVKRLHWTLDFKLGLWVLSRVP